MIITMKSLNISISNLIENLVLDHKPENGTLWKILFLYMPPVILFQGSIGNIFSFLIFFKLGHLKNKFKPDTLITFGKKISSKMNSILRQPNLNKSNSMINKKLKFNRTFKCRQSVSRTGGLTIYLYLSLLALFDLGVLYFGLFNDWINYISSVNLKDYSSFVCKFFTFCGYLCSHCSSSLIFITSFIRFMAVYDPYLASNLTSIKSVKLVSSILLIFFTVFNLHLFSNMKLEEFRRDVHLIEILKSSFNNSEYTEIIYQLKAQVEEGINLPYLSSKNSFKCKIVQNDFTKTLWPIADKLVYSVLPFILISIFNVLILINISKVQKYKYILYMSKFKNEECSNVSIDKIKFQSHALCETKNEDGLRVNSQRQDHEIKTIRKNSQLVQLKNKPNNLSRISVCLIDDRKGNDVKERIIHFKKYHLVCKKFTIMLLSLSFCFLLLTLPVVVIYLLLEPIIQGFQKMELNESNSHFEQLQNIQEVSSLLMYLNHSINFFIYFATSSRFRQYFRKKFFKKSYFTNSFLKLVEYLKCKKSKPNNENVSSLYD